MGETRYFHWLYQERSDEELLDDALKRAFPPISASEQRFEDLLHRLREVERRTVSK